jgi:homoserine trans-succinylase
VRVERGDAPIELVRFADVTFFATLRRKLKWATRPGSDDL